MAAYARIECEAFGEPMDSYVPKVNLNTSHSKRSILFTCQNISRQQANQTSGDMALKASKASHEINHRRKKGQISNKDAIKIWKEEVAKEGLVYKNFSKEDSENWYWILGLNELRIGHSLMYVSKSTDGTPRSIEVKKYLRAARTHLNDDH